MLINCAHKSWKNLALFEAMELPSMELLQFKFLEDSEIGDLPAAWNWLADERGENPSAKLVHWTTGIPAFPQYAQTPMADLWAAEALKITHATN